MRNTTEILSLICLMLDVSLLRDVEPGDLYFEGDSMG